MEGHYFWIALPNALGGFLVSQATLLVAPNSNGEAAIDEEMVVVFFGLLAKRAKPTILPTAPP
jgi:hypothetical protein